MNLQSRKKYLFIINPGSGPDNKPWQEIIRNYFTEKQLQPEFHILSSPPDQDALTNAVKKSDADVMVAVGGDGTVSMVAKIVAACDRTLGILPGGSANGMAKELNIPADPVAALDALVNGTIRTCDAIKINDKHICLHLCDIGINAQLIKYFEQGRVRGKLGYGLMIAKTLWFKKKLSVIIQSQNREIRREAFMVVLANASKYGTGALINPKGQFDDGVFEIIIIKKLAISELIKMIFHNGSFNPKKIEMLSGTSVTISSIHSAHFQVDGEYLGKVHSVNAKILPAYIHVVLPK